VEEDDDERVRQSVSERESSSSASRVEWRVIVDCGGVWTSGMQGRWQVHHGDKRG
jgi:hypothetical protein